MAVGQGALTPSEHGRTLDVAALDAAELRLEVRAVSRCFEHGRLLREVLQLHRILTAAGAGLSTGPQVALLLQLSETAAQNLLAEAQLLTGLPGGIEALDCGLLTVAQSATFLRAVGHLPPTVRASVWSRLQARLLAACDSGTVLTPARLAPLLAGWVLAADPAGAQERRRRAESAGDVTYRRRDDGVGDLFATGIPAPVLQAMLCRIRDASQPFGTADERTAGKRRVDALVDLLLGRQPLGSSEHAPDAVRDHHTGGEAVEAGAASPAARGSRPPCGCPLHSPVPCGTDVVVHVPLGAALGTTDELAELVGHGPLDPDQLQALLLSGPRSTAVHVDDRGTPVAVGRRELRPERGDPAAVLAALLDLATGPPGPVHPRHPFDHPPSPGAHAPAPQVATGRPRPGEPSGGESPPAGRPALRSGIHPTGSPGAYRPSRRLRRLVEHRSPLCEWPACGARAARCDLDHDTPWPAGPTCACNLGPLCRRHHRLKQQLVQKRRTSAGDVTWADPTGRRWTAPTQHRPPALPLRPPTRSSRRDDAEQHVLSPAALAELLAPDDDDPIRVELRSPDIDPDQPDEDRLAERLRTDDGWGLRLDDPWRWAA